MSKRFYYLVFLLSAGVVLLAGCGGRETTVIQPTEQYELTDQEQQNREREQAMMAEQRQQ